MEPGHIYYKAIKPDIGSYSLTKVSDKQKLKEISKKIQDLVKKNKELKTDLKISNPETKDLIIHLSKKTETELPPINLRTVTPRHKNMKKFLSMTIIDIYKSLGSNGKMTKLILNIEQN